MKNDPGLKDKFAVYTYPKEQGAALLVWAREQTDTMFSEYKHTDGSGTLPVEILEAWQKCYSTNVIFAGGIVAEQFGSPPQEGHPVDELRAVIRDTMLEANLDQEVGGAVLFKMFLNRELDLTMHGVLAAANDDWEHFATLVRAEMHDRVTEAGSVDAPHPEPSDQTTEHEEPAS